MPPLLLAPLLLALLVVPPLLPLVVLPRLLAVPPFAFVVEPRVVEPSPPVPPALAAPVPVTEAPPVLLTLVWDDEVPPPLPCGLSSVAVELLVVVPSPPAGDGVCSFEPQPIELMRVNR